MKYIRFAGHSNNIHLFPDYETHSNVADLLGGRVISAGFVHMTDAGLSCSGESFSLDCESLPDDSQELNSLLRD